MKRDQSNYSIEDNQNSKKSKLLNIVFQNIILNFS